MKLFVILTIIIFLVFWLFFRRSKGPKQLIIIGNGFDLYHGIPSSYLNFQDYLQKADGETYAAVEKYLYLQNNEQWNDFEKSLSNLDEDELLDEMRNYLESYSHNEWKDSMNHDFQYEVNQVLDTLNDKLKMHFLNWILSLKISHHSSTPKLALPKNASYLSFNYTNTLEKLYNIPVNQILYIHGKAVDQFSDLVLGHGFNPQKRSSIPTPITYEDFKDGNYSSETDWRIEEAKSYIQSYFTNSYKNASLVINQNISFFRRIKSITEIYVMGHSMKDIDAPYFDSISKVINHNKVNWIVSYHRSEDVENSKKLLTKIGIDIKKVSFKKIEDQFSTQMSLFT